MHSIPALIWTVSVDDGRLRSKWHATSDEVASPAPVQASVQRTDVDTLAA